MRTFTRIRSVLHRSLHPRGARGVIAQTATVAALAVVATVALTPPPMPSEAAILSLYYADDTQELTVASTATPATVTRENYSATAGVETLVAGGTNHDWAKLVLLDGGWEMSETNVTVVLRWMRQENGPDDWFNRNNPLNNGWGSGGGAGLGSYPNLQVAAENAAAALHGNPGYGSIVAALSSGAEASVIESAIWASPWATSHYANGAHWHYTDVPVVSAPASAWG